MKYLFYTLYRHLLKVKTNDTPAFSAIALITLFECFNIMTVLQLLPVSLQPDFKNKNQGIVSYAAAGLIVLAINYFLLLKNVSYLCDKYKNESENKKASGTLLLLTYVLLSVLAFFGTIK
jgi:uncharacterized membrane protein